MGQTIERAFISDTTATPKIRIHYDIAKSCKSECHPELQAADYKQRDLDLFVSAKNERDPDDESIMMANYWVRRIYVCPTCRSMMIAVRKFKRPPAVLVMSIAGMTTRIDEVITFENINYSVFAVAYRGNGHFMALIKLDNVIFAYDGMIADGMLRPAQADAFRNDYGSMRAQMVWYTQNL